MSSEKYKNRISYLVKRISLVEACGGVFVDWCGENTNYGSWFVGDSLVLPEARMRNIQ